MFYLKNTLLEVKHNRKGTFVAIATRDFTPEDETFYPLALAQKTDGDRISAVVGLNNFWLVGEDIPCRASLCTIEVIGHKSEKTQ